MRRKKIIIIIIIVFIALSITYISNILRHESSAPGKAVSINSFDEFIAYGEKPVAYYDYEMIINSDLLNEEDKKELYNFSKKEKFFSKEKRCAYQVAFGKREGKDIVQLRLLYSYYYAYTLRKKSKTFVFESNLPYKYDDIILKIKSDYDIIVDNDVLSDCRTDDNGTYIRGLFINFDKVSDKEYKIFYILKLEDKSYNIYM